MKLPDDDGKRTPRDRFRTILSADKADQPGPEPRKPAVVNLPKIGESGEAASGEASAPGAKAGSSIARLLPGFWTIGSVLSVIANVVLLVVLNSVLGGVGSPAPADAGSDALMGLYTSLEQMDQAHIRTTIPVQSSVALDASIPVQTSTNITLASDVFVDGAHVRISTGLIDIDAPASVTLPAGTSLDVALDLTLPLQTNVPIAVDVPVDIAVGDTDLHAAIISLQDAIRPVLCAAKPNATGLDGAPVCR
jgi:hypothetical protein